MIKTNILKSVRSNAAIRLMLKAAGSFAGGLTFSLPYLSGTMSPFAASLCASLDGIYSIFACVGAALGFFIFHSGISSFRYFTVIVISCVTLSISLKAFGFSRADLLRPLCPGVCSLAVNCAFLLSQKFSLGLIVSTVCETALCTAAVPVFTRGVAAFRDKLRTPLKADEKDLVFQAVLISLAAAHLKSIGATGEIICFFLFYSVLLCAGKKYSFTGSAVCGACCAFACCAGGEADIMCAVLPLLGCALPLLKEKKRVFAALFCAAGALVACALNDGDDYLPFFAAAAAGVAYCLIPIKYLAAQNDNGESTVITNEYASLSHRDGMIKAVEGIGDCVEAVRKTLEPLVAPKLAEELNRAREKICAECEINSSCVNEIRNPSHACYQEIADGFLKGEIDFSLFPDNFTERCYCADKVLAAMKNAYLIHCARADADNKISRMQAVTCAQFKSFGGIIGGVCDSVIRSGETLSYQDSLGAACAEEFGIKLKSAKLVKDTAGRESYNLSFYKPQENFNVTALTERLCAQTGLALDFPVLIQKDDIYTLIFKQKERIGFKIAAAVRPADGKSVCGDYYRCFKDSAGRQCVMLSDGMGTGSRAAVDSAFTCETFCSLIKSGIDEKSAAAAVNCAMMIKSTDESLSTIDFVRIDSVLCKADIFKCGAAPTFILTDNKTMLLEAESTPVGILESVDMTRTTLNLTPGDIILTVSDGVSGERFGWISAELKSFDGDSASQLAKHILQCAADRNIGKRSDDMTVIASIITEK